MKLDENILAMDPSEAEELAARLAALEVADSVLDVRYSFFQVGGSVNGETVGPSVGWT